MDESCRGRQRERYLEGVSTEDREHHHITYTNNARRCSCHRKWTAPVQPVESHSLPTPSSTPTPSLPKRTFPLLHIIRAIHSAPLSPWVNDARWSVYRTVLSDGFMKTPSALSYCSLNDRTALSSGSRFLQPREVCVL